MPSLKAGKLRPLAVTITRRFDAMPEFPMIPDFVAGYESSAIYGMTGPKGAPTDILEPLNREVNAGPADRQDEGAYRRTLGCLPLPLSR